MSAVSCSVMLSDSAPMPIGAHRNDDGRAIACVDVVFPCELSLYGSPRAMRRLAAAATKAANEAERLPVPKASRPPFSRPLAFE